MISLKRGDILLDKYKIERVLGEGGMGIVVCARHIALDDRVAIKLLLESALREPGAVERFIREARAARKIKSEHVVQIADVGVLPAGGAYIVMEYLEGSDLHKISKRRKQQAVELVVDYILQACEALAEAHAQGIVHRDLKPANLFLTRRADGSPLVKVLDFGISKQSGTNLKGIENGLTRTGVLLGSPNYMAPEQVASPKSVDERADIWALGVILYVMLTGVLPFRAESQTLTFVRILHFEPAPPTEHRSDLPEGLSAVILQCLAKDRQQRFANVAALSSALAPFGSAQSRVSVERVSRVLGVPLESKSSEGDAAKAPRDVSIPEAPPSATSDRYIGSNETTHPFQPNTAALSVWSQTLAGFRAAVRTTSFMLIAGVFCAVVLGATVFYTVPLGARDLENPAGASPIPSMDRPTAPPDGAASPAPSTATKSPLSVPSSTPMAAPATSVTNRTKRQGQETGKPKAQNPASGRRPVSSSPKPDPDSPTNIPSDR